jgi:hypothetical protein
VEPNVVVTVDSRWNDQESMGECKVLDNPPVPSHNPPVLSINPPAINIVVTAVHLVNSSMRNNSGTFWGLCQNVVDAEESH